MAPVPMVRVGDGMKHPNGKHRGPITPHHTVLHYCSPDWEQRTFCGLGTEVASYGHIRYTVDATYFKSRIGSMYLRPCERCAKSLDRILKGRKP